MHGNDMQCQKPKIKPMGKASQRKEPNFALSLLPNPHTNFNIVSNMLTHSPRVSMSKNFVWVDSAVTALQEHQKSVSVWICLFTQYLICLSVYLSIYLSVTFAVSTKNILEPPQPPMWIRIFRPNLQDLKTWILLKLLHRFWPNFADWQSKVKKN